MPRNHPTYLVLLLVNPSYGNVTSSYGHQTRLSMRPIYSRIMSLKAKVYNIQRVWVKMTGNMNDEAKIITAITVRPNELQFSVEM
ncbi:hypothetical protein T4C_4326 [Trichinella pseudospiralis]|uniref:Uncharacterized protein n=1 Tax=Trichinella pseudospiralis TaxID=6337 RepID=A0A0V1IQX6_TRIPS|nr:hypothetical protein T4C_4326 [Trichinella pseudospiralis]